MLQALGSEPIQYAVPVVKYDRKGYKPRSRQLLLTPNAVVIVEDAKVKQRIDYANLTGISVSSLSDSLFVLHVQREDNKQKGDVVLQSDHVIETLTKTALSADRVSNININQGSITFAGGPGRDGIIDFTPGSELLITKAKNGHLAVVAPRLNSVMKVPAGPPPASQCFAHPPPLPSYQRLELPDRDPGTPRSPPTNSHPLLVPLLGEQQGPGAAPGVGQAGPQQ